MFDNRERRSSRTRKRPKPAIVQGAPHILRRIAPHLGIAVIAAIVLTSAAFTAVAAATPPGFDTGRAARGKSATGPWTWSAPSRSWTIRTRVLPPALVRRGPRTTLTRGQFLAALLRLQRVRGDRSAMLMRSRRHGRALRDARAGSAAARAVANGWFSARNGAFEGSSPITADDATRAVMAALGMQRDVGRLAITLRDELPGTSGVRWYYASAHALARTLGLRYNVLDPWDELELGPNEPLNVAHGSYMLRAAASVESWKRDEAHRLAETFDLPDLGANQLLVLGTGVRQLGQPYVWAGETEGDQPEGHGGFDCSGFTIRIVNDSGVPADQLDHVDERTTYTQSAIPSRDRLTIDQLQPADLVFFGDSGPSSTPNQNFHVGVYMGNGWFIHSSGGNGGVAINSLDGWWGDHFSWGRRALRQP